MKMLVYIKEFLLQPVDLFKTIRYRMAFVGELFLFFALFIALFVPFSLDSWIEYVSPIKRFAIPGLIVIGSSVILLSQLLQAWVLKNVVLRVYHLFAGFFIEVLMLSLCLNRIYMTSGTSYWQTLPFTSKMVVLVLALGYFIGIMVLLLIKLLQEKRTFPATIVETEKRTLTTSSVEWLNIADENGQLRLSLKPTDLLYIESADNYVLVCFRKEQRILKEMVRNSLKKIEADLSGSNCIRCHRSYLINLDAVSYIHKDGRDYEAIVENTNFPIPISRVYVKIVKELLGV